MTTTRTDAIILGTMVFLVAACAVLAFEIYRRPQFSDVSQLIALEAPVTAMEKGEIRHILDQMVRDINAADVVRANILAELKLMQKERRDRKAEHAEMLQRLKDLEKASHGPE